MSSGRAPRFVRFHPLRSIVPLAVAFALWPWAARADPVAGEWVSKWRADLAFAADSLPRIFFHARISGDSVSARWNSAAGVWRFDGRLAGERLVGIVRYRGLDYPAALERGAADPSGP